MEKMYKYSFKRYQLNKNQENAKINQELQTDQRNALCSSVEQNVVDIDDVGGVVFVSLLHIMAVLCLNIAA